MTLKKGRRTDFYPDEFTLALSRNSMSLISVFQPLHSESVSKVVVLRLHVRMGLILLCTVPVISRTIQYENGWGTEYNTPRK
jgi:hypothetical protein